MVTASPPNSTAVAKAELNQDIDQSNENEASIVLPELSPEAAAPSPNTIVLPTEEADQFEGVLQANLSLQAAAAFATAEFGDVDVEQGGQLTAGLDGIDASSEAIAKADLEQEAEQKNEDFEGHQPRRRGR